MTSAEVINLIHDRHADALVVEQCKTGPTQWTRGKTLRIFDAWVLLPTWSPATCVGYEVKVSRSDFVRDEKWHEYLKYCNQFYIAAPKGLVKDGELPEGVGLMEVIGKGGGQRLVTRRKAFYREIEWPRDLLLYILMNRAIPGKEHEFGQPRRETASYWRQWLERRDEDKHLGREVSGSIGKRYRQMEKDLQAAKYEAETAKRIWAEVEKLGVTKETGTWELRRRILSEDIFTMLPQIHAEVAQSSRRLDNLIAVVRDRLKETHSA